jgi:hypothetical protein
MQTGPRVGYINSWSEQDDAMHSNMKRMALKEKITLETDSRVDTRVKTVSGEKQLRVLFY